ncbi:MAG TPA: Ig-like domain-containing protein, partial [Pirellulaceae bacterium]|nr:Ig-like domain-containing protein [Pirellulaceae bacterium]
MANTFAGGNLNSIKSHQDLVYMIRHSVTGQVTPTGATAFGLEVALPGDPFGENDETVSSLTKMGTPAGSNSRRGVSNNQEGVYIDDLIIGFAERGEMVTNAQTGAAGGMNFRDNIELLNNNLPSAHTETLVGEYQLEVRRNSDFWMDNPFGPSPPRVFVAGIDTNDRVNQSVTLTAPAGSEIFDGQTFVISDGVNSLTFEFEDLDLPGGDAQVGVTSGRVQVGFRPAFTDDQVAEAIRDAVNSNAVQGILKLVASQDDGTVTGTKSTGNRIHLYGPAVSDTQGHTNTFGLTATVHNWYGDSNSVRDQGQVLIYSNLIRDSLNWGIQIDNGARDRTDLATLAGVLPHPGAPIKFDDLNSERLAPGAVLENNVLVRGGQGGIKISGDNTNAPNNDAAVPFVRVVNNTIFGTRAGDAGIWVEQYASPTLLNNVVANLGTGIRVIPDTSTNTTVIGGTIYQNNNFNVLGLTIGSFPILLGAAAPLFVNSAADNFYLAAASLAIDSSLGSLQDRNDYKTRVKQPLGIAASPIIAPDHDITGQLRYDDPTINTPSSQGTDVYIDRGAYDRNDFNGPFAELVVPKDNDSEGRDVDATLTVVQLDEGVYSSFDIVLKDGLGSSTPVEGTGIDQSTVNTNNVLVFRDGKALTPSVDYIIGFQAGSNLLRITPLSGVWRNDAAYVVTLSGIRDKAGNLLQPNQADGATRFTILMPGVDLDYGDLQGDNPPTLQQFPTLFTGNGARHVVYDNDTTIYLGRFVDTETDAAPNVLSNGDDIVVGPTIASITSPTSLAVDTTASNGHLVWNSGTGRLTIGAVVDGDGFAITNRGVTVSFVLDSDGREPAAPTIVIPFNVGDSTSTIADKIVEGLNRSHVANIVTGAGLSIAGQNLAGDVKITADSDDDSLRIGGDLRIPLNPYTNSTPLSIVASGSGYLDAWFDWNGDGDWADPSERYFFSQALVNGINTLNIVVPQASRAVVAPTAGQPGFRDIAARFRYSQSGGLTTDNIWVGGEVEDYLLRLYGGRPPVPANDSYTVFEDNTLTTTDVTGATTPGSANDNSVLSNGVDTDADGDAMRVFLVTPPQHAASFTLNPDGTFTYVPLTNYNGVDTFVYRLRDMSAGQLVSNTFGTATITVREVNDAPIAYNDLPTPTTLTTPEDPTGPAYYTFNSNVLVANDKTPFGDPSYTAPAGTVDDESAQTLKVSSLWDGAAKVLSVTTAKGGTITLSGLGGTLTYQPPADFNQDWNPGGGDDSFIYFVQDNGTTGGAADPLDSVAPATAFIRVTAVNDPPVVLYNANPAFPVVPTLVMNEDDPAGATFGNEVTIADPDLGHGEPVDNVSVTLTVAHGTINVVNAGALGTLSSNGTANVTMTGS